MATILVVEDAPDLGLFETEQLREAGHRVLRCSGSPTPYGACPMMRHGTCPLAETADVIVFSCALFSPIRGQGYRGEHLLRAYRAHAIYSRTPMLIVSVGRPEAVEGTGPYAVVQKFSEPHAVLEGVERLLTTAATGKGSP